MVNIGDKFGNLVAVREISRGFWELRCVCGNTVERKIDNLTASIRQGNVPKCRQCHTATLHPPRTEPKRLDIAGQQFGNLTAIEWTGRSDNRRYAIWKFKCICGEIVEKSAGNVIGAAKRPGRVPSCGKSTCNGHEKLPPGQSAINDIFTTYKRNAVQRGYSFELSKEQLAELISQNCHYCGATPSSCRHKKSVSGRYYGDFCRNGIDRLDNTKGYTLSNTVPCCYMCNRAKNNESLEVFSKWVSGLIKHFPKAG